MKQPCTHQPAATRLEDAPHRTYKTGKEQDISMYQQVRALYQPVTERRSKGRLGQISGGATCHIVCICLTQEEKHCLETFQATCSKEAMWYKFPPKKATAATNKTSSWAIAKPFLQDPNRRTNTQRKLSHTQRRLPVGR